MSAPVPVEAASVAAGLRPLPRATLLRVLIACLAASAWLTLWAWSISPYARYVDHGRWTDAGIAGEICRLVPGGELVLSALLYACAWLTMIAAMMLPTTLPLLEIFRRIAAGRPDSNQLIALVVSGFACAWLVFGLAAHAADWMLRAAVAGVPWLAGHGWAIGATVLGAAGLFQFSALKYRCLDKCRTPLGFVIERWRGKSPALEAFRLGVDHGAFCVGCCWALMLLMFVVGSGNLGWMLALSAMMAMEKNLPWGRRLSAPLGIALLVWASALLVLNTGAAAG